MPLLTIARKRPVPGLEFSNWNKALQKLDKHQQSQSHKLAANNGFERKEEKQEESMKCLMLSCAHAAQEMERYASYFIL